MVIFESCVVFAGSGRLCITVPECSVRWLVPHPSESRLKGTADYECCYWFNLWQSTQPCAWPGWLTPTHLVCLRIDSDFSVWLVFKLTLPYLILLTGLLVLTSWHRVYLTCWLINTINFNDCLCQLKINLYFEFIWALIFQIVFYWVDTM
jgi:hypothetical protein